ncbi:adenosine deaminase [Paraferrimonas sp. SM1919]|uniref:adenosine deaminase n=1 Tax=Paraferrimonas sp. SM1919 TaxID=2662263 RepID=UPI0013D76C50|nr:adenosine deaminase [Paraferrimonas sp. SM1919]
MDYHRLPKIDLHCHLDGSVRPTTIIDLAIAQNIELPSYDVNELKRWLVVDENCQSLSEYLQRFELPLKVLQTTEAIERVTYELYEDAASENVKYLEVRFGPQLHRVNGLSYQQIFAAVKAGLSKAVQNLDIKGNVIISMLKHLSVESMHEVLEQVQPFVGDPIVGFDLAGAENPGFAQQYVDVCDKARRLGLNITIHAGEQGDSQNVVDAVSLLKAQRIGHGLALMKRTSDIDFVRNNITSIETCPTSNTQTKAVDSLAKHPLPQMLQQRLPVSINTDNRTVSNTTMTKEVEKVFKQFALTKETYATIYQSSINACFADDQVKAWLSSRVDS